MDRKYQDKNEYELVVSSPEHCLEQTSKNNNRESSFTISDTKKIIPVINQETETKWFYTKKINKIKFKNMIWKIMTFGCLNYLINKKTISEVKPWKEKLIILQTKNKEEMLKSNQLISWCRNYYYWKFKKKIC